MNGTHVGLAYVPSVHMCVHIRICVDIHVCICLTLSVSLSLAVSFLIFHFSLHQRLPE